MTPTKPTEPEQPIWFDIDLETVPEYTVWKPKSLEWALTVNWQHVNTLVREHLDDIPATLLDTQLIRTAHWNALTPVDRTGLASLYNEPPYATTPQISRGGHRIVAMRQQGVRWALGHCFPSDVGEGGIPDLCAYLPA
jgi:hypothetical protein